MTASLGNSNKVMVPEACPLDMLLKDRDREGARKARVETKRKGAHSDPFDSDPALSRGSNTFETPKRVHPRAKTESPGSDMPSPHDGHVLLMGAAAREELLGKKAAKAVGKILDSDRKKRSNTEEKQSDVLFWSKDVKGDNDIVPDLVATNTCHPLLTALNDAMNRKEYDVASHLVDSGALSSAPLSVPLLDWLFATAMSTACRDVSLSAYRSLLVLHREVCSPVALARPYLSSTRLLRPLIKLGVNTQVAEMFGAEVDDMVSPMGIIPEMKVEMLCRFFSMLEVLSRSQSIDPMAIPSIVSILLLLSLDPSAVPELQQDAVSAIEAVLASLNVTRIIELDTCKFVLRVTKELAFTPDLQLRLLTLLPGCSPSSGRVRRWTAWAMLGGDLQTFHDCSDVPPIQLMVDLFSKTSPGVVKLEVTPDTDYQQLGALVNILSVAMTDVDAYVRHANGSVLTRHLYEALEQMNGKIVDNRAAHMDRTKTKEAINRLHKRLIYQRHAVLEKLRTKTGKMDQFLVAKPKSASRTKSEDRSE
ncbi:hypothetical protein JB92DRAFT_210172 [Gautieria morchelliformis]|nr:hypothetical protein JB92DRAFT_210172 [Gautieria morchelliformis]